MIFLSTPSARRATEEFSEGNSSKVISIHALREEGDPRSPLKSLTFPRYFYPRPPRGGRPVRKAAGLPTNLFLSTPSARRATRTDTRDATTIAFLSTPSARRATRRSAAQRPRRSISIHALREEGDAETRTLPRLFRISIHALREEGDRKARATSTPSSNFYPRPPRGGRPCSNPARFVRGGNFYPRPPRGGRPKELEKHTYIKTNFYPRPPRGGRRPA